MRVMPELTPSEARRVKAAHILAGAGIVAIVATKLTLTAAIAFRKGVRKGERRTLRRLAEGEAIEDIVAHKGGRRCCVMGHHHRGCCIHGDGKSSGRGQDGVMGDGEQVAETA